MQLRHVGGLRLENAQPQHIVFLARAHEADAVAQLHRTVHDAEEHHHALIAVVPRVEDQRLERPVLPALRRGQTVHDGLQHVRHAHAGLGGDGQGLGAVQPDGFLDLGLDPVHLRAGQVDLVEHRHDLVVMVQRQIDVGQSLRLHALGGVHHQQRPFAGGQRAGDLVVEVHMAGGIDEVELVLLPVRRHIGDTHGLCLDGDAALPFQVHLVQILLPRLTLTDHLGQLKDAVGKGGFAVVDMGNDAEVADKFLLGHGRRTR